MQTNQSDFIQQFTDKTQKKPCLTAIENGICKADCCRQVVIPFMEINYDNMKDKMYKEPDEILHLFDVVYPYSEDLICVYLNQNTNLCQIYDFRPQICSLYGRQAHCLHYDKSDKFIPIKKRKVFDFETRQEVGDEYSALKRLLANKPIQLKDANSLEMSKLRSMATPVMFIRALQYVNPNLVKDVDHLI